MLHELENEIREAIVVCEVEMEPFSNNISDPHRSSPVVIVLHLVAFYDWNMKKYELLDLLETSYEIFCSD